MREVGRWKPRWKEWGSFDRITKKAKCSHPCLDWTERNRRTNMDPTGRGLDAIPADCTCVVVDAAPAMQVRAHVADLVSTLDGISRDLVRTFNTTLWYGSWLGRVQKDAAVPGYSWRFGYRPQRQKIPGWGCDRPNCRLLFMFPIWGRRDLTHTWIHFCRKLPEVAAAANPSQADVDLKFCRSSPGPFPLFARASPNRNLEGNPGASLSLEARKRPWKMSCGTRQAQRDRNMQRRFCRELQRIQCPVRHCFVLARVV